MKKLSLKGRITLGIISGLFFAGMMAGFDYFNHTTFNLKKFMFHAIFMGVFNALAFGRSKAEDETASKN